MLGHDIGNCIVTQGWGGKPGRATRPSWRVAGRCGTADLRAGRAVRARTWPGRWGGGGGVVRNTNGRIVTGGRPGCWVYHKTGCNTASSNTAIRPSMRHDLAQEAHDTAGRAVTRRDHERNIALRHDAPAHACARRQGRSRLRHGHDTVLYTPRHGAQLPLCARPRRSGRTGWVRVCVLYTRLSFDSVHYSESLCGTLFMSIVHEVFKKKIKNKKILK